MATIESTFSESEIFSVDELTQFIDEDSSDIRATMLKNKLLDFIFYDGDHLYTYDKTTVSYRRHKNSEEDDIIVTIGCRFLSESLQHIKTTNKLNFDMLNKVHKGKMQTLCRNQTIRALQCQLKTGLKNDGVFKPLLYQLHYKNGYIDIKTQTFKQREFKKDYTYFYINRNYKPSTPEQREKINNSIFNKIYPKNEVCETMKYVLGSALTGTATKEQIILILMGKGSSGKSTVLQILQRALTDCYFQIMENDAFNESNTNKDKTFSVFVDNINILLIWCNEPKTSKLDTELLKGVCEGKGKCKMLYKNGTFTFSHNALVIFTANIMPSFVSDSGMSRRLNGYEHESLFSGNAIEDDAINHIYKKDEDLITNIEKEQLLDAFIDILIPYGNAYSNGTRLKFPAEFKDTTNHILEMNDEWIEFLERHITITNKHDTDYINKVEMKDLYDKMFPKKMVNDKIMLARLKEKGIKYDKEKTKNKVKGCYTGVCIKLPEVKCEVNTEEFEITNVTEKTEIEKLRLEVQCILYELNEKDKTIKQLTDENIKLKFMGLKITNEKN